jgi:hypothetical protein
VIRQRIHSGPRNSRPEIGNDGWLWPTGVPLDTGQQLAAQGSRGEDLDNALRYQTARHIRLASLVEQPPDPDNRVTLSPRDSDGVPLPQIHYRLDDYVKAGFAASVPIPGRSRCPTSSSASRIARRPWPKRSAASSTSLARTLELL